MLYILQGIINESYNVVHIAGDNVVHIAGDNVGHIAGDNVGHIVGDNIVHIVGDGDEGVGGLHSPDLVLLEQSTCRLCCQK